MFAKFSEIACRVTQFITPKNIEPQPKRKKGFQEKLESPCIQLVGTARFELATTCPPDKCATRLRYAPNETEGFYHFRFLLSRNNLIIFYFFISQCLSAADNRRDNEGSLTS